MTFSEVIADLKDAVSLDDSASCLAASLAFDAERQVENGNLGGKFKVYRTTGISVEYIVDGYGTFSPSQAAKIHDFAVFCYSVLKEKNSTKKQAIIYGTYDPS